MAKCCEVLNINGVNCHESGCTDSWRDETRECKWCGSEFKPEEWHNTFCDGECAENYYG